MCIKVQKGNAVVFYEVSTIEDFAYYDFRKGGIVAKLRDGKELVEVFLTEEEIDAIYEKLEIRPQTRLLRSGYISPAERERSRKVMSDFLNS